MEKSLADYQDLLVANPADADAHYHLGSMLAAAGNAHDAVTHLRKAVEFGPTRIAAWVNLCVASKKIGQWKEAEAAIRQACALAGVSPTADIPENQMNVLHWHLALLELQHGDYLNGFSHFRARFYGGTSWKRMESPKPLWQGEDVAGKTLFVVAEQGHGDTLMMARYLPLLKQCGARLHLAVQPALISYLQGWDALEDVFPLGAGPKVDFDYHTSLFDLPYCFKTVPGTIPAVVPYLPKVSKGPTLSASSLPKIGVLWRGQPANMLTDLRKIPLSIFATIFVEQGASYFNLTRELEVDEMPLLTSAGVQNLADDLPDFAAVAHVVNQLDLVITCDTALAHMAGGLGKKVWIILAATPDWRWFEDRADSPWYPTARLFRRGLYEEWDAVMARVRGELRDFLGHARKS